MKKHSIILLFASCVALYSFTLVDQSKDWVVPESAKKVKNPTDKTDKENLAIGKSLFSKHCQSCHGKEGYGDGPKAKELKGQDLMGDFSSAEFQSQTDGALFYKMTTGRDDMPAFDKKIPDAEDRWLIVNYIRTLKQ
ncbi:MAG TPA: cytochrome c [Cyclobacteriaceae bacterium]|nr:cytochrome c [Cyclobacteriaceae bacterium]